MDVKPVIPSPEEHVRSSEIRQQPEIQEAFI
jgi:hypothetical protein